MHTNFIDRLLAKVDGEIATVWISEFITLDNPPLRSELLRTFQDLVFETPRLNLCWDDRSHSWKENYQSAQAVEKSFFCEDFPQSYRDLTDLISQSRIDLRRDLPFRIGLWRLKDGEPGKWLLSFQIHHSIADARGLMFLTERFWELFNGQRNKNRALKSGGARNLDFVIGAVKHLPFCILTAGPRYRTLLKRAASLERNANQIGNPIVRSIRFPLPSDFQNNSKARIELFFSAVVGAVLEQRLVFDSKFPLRLRIPIDLRRQLNLEPAIGNACSLVGVDLDIKELKRILSEKPEQLGEWINSQLRTYLKKGVHWSTLVECLLISSLASPKRLKANLRPDLLENPRSNSLVVTYVGQMGACHSQAPFQIKTLCTQTPTWGVNGLTHEGYLYLNFTSFDGIWDRERLESFVRSSLRWIDRTYSIQGEVIGQ